MNSQLLSIRLIMESNWSRWLLPTLKSNYLFYIYIFLWRWWRWGDGGEEETARFSEPKVAQVVTRGDEQPFWETWCRLSITTAPGGAFYQGGVRSARPRTHLLRARGVGGWGVGTEKEIKKKKPQWQLINGREPITAQVTRSPPPPPPPPLPQPPALMTPAGTEPLSLGMDRTVPHDAIDLESPRQQNDSVEWQKKKKKIPRSEWSVR